MFGFKIVLIGLASTLSLTASDSELLNIERKIEKLQAQIDALKPKNDLNVTFPGQYRVNFYSVDNDISTQDQQTAARLRIRQNIDIVFTPQLKSSVRFQLSHTNSSKTDATDVNGNGVLLRHAVIDYQPSKRSQFKAGLVPVTEYQDDVLYSKSWGYNPFALEGFYHAGDMTLHYFAANLSEGTESNATDDKLHYHADLLYDVSPKFNTTLSISHLDIVNGTQRGRHSNVAGKLLYKTDTKSKLSFTAMSSQTDKSLLANGKDAQGHAFRLEYTKDFETLKLGLLTTFASGKNDGSGFLVPMSFIQTNSYWGYTGIVTVRYETDTGFASDSVHISNNGYGMSTVQAKAEYTLSDDHRLYLAAAWFGNSQITSREKNVASELFFMDKYRLNSYLSLHTGFAYAKIYDSLSGYGLGVATAGFNQSQGETRYKRAFYGRLQLEF